MKFYLLFKEREGDILPRQSLWEEILLRNGHEVVEVLVGRAGYAAFSRDF